MLFSPISERSRGVRVLYFFIYIALSLGALTMILPFVIMIAGSVESSPSMEDSRFFPSYLIDDTALWRRYLESKYQGSLDLLRMAWNDPSADHRCESLPVLSPGEVSDWLAFVEEHPLREDLLAVGFVRSTRRMPSFYGRVFRTWLIEQFQGDLSLLNQELGTQFPRVTAIFPPVVGITGQPPSQQPLLRAYQEFSRTVPIDRKFAWSAGGYYRAVFLPRTYGSSVFAYNASHGTQYSSYADVPFPSTAPSVGRDPWFLYVSKVLRSDFVKISGAAEDARARMGISHDEYVRTIASADELQVTTADCLFAEWMAARGNLDSRLPQKAFDRMAFEREKGFWRWELVKLNYVTVLDEIALHGRAVTNTLILVLLMVAGALVINPLAAYALSRYKLKQTYTILLFFLGAIAFPVEVTMIPIFLQLKELHLLNTFGALVLPSIANGFSIFLLKGFFDSLPRELYEAAELDGASEACIFWQITMTLSKPILAVIALQAFVTAYSMFFFAVILAPDPSMWTLMVYIYQLRQYVEPPVVYASLIITAIPTLLVFIFCQNIILRGIVVPSEK